MRFRLRIKRGAIRLVSVLSLLLSTTVLFAADVSIPIPAVPDGWEVPSTGIATWFAYFLWNNRTSIREFFSGSKALVVRQDSLEEKLAEQDERIAQPEIKIVAENGLVS